MAELIKELSTKSVRQLCCRIKPVVDVLYSLSSFLSLSLSKLSVSVGQGPEDQMALTKFVLCQDVIAISFCFWPERYSPEWIAGVEFTGSPYWETNLKSESWWTLSLSLLIINLMRYSHLRSFPLLDQRRNSHGQSNRLTNKLSQTNYQRNPKPQHSMSTKRQEIFLVFPCSYWVWKKMTRLVILFWNTGERERQREKKRQKESLKFECDLLIASQVYQSPDNHEALCQKRCFCVMLI